MKVRKKGFTLVELLAAIAVLAIVLTVTVPSVSAIIKNSTEEAFKNDVKSVVKEIKLKSLEYSSFDPATVNESTISQILSIPSANYDKVFIYKRTNDVAIRIIGTNEWEGLVACGTYDEMAVNEGTSCNNDSISPTITILGDNPATINVGNTYTDAGATASDNLDGDITSYIEVVSNVNTSVIGQYTVTYRVLDSSGNLGTAVRDVYVLDANAPLITVLGNNPATVSIGSTYTDDGATAMDDVDGDITSKITTTSTVNTSTIGTYTVTYNVTDTAGNTGVASRTVNVVDNAIPTVAFSMNGNNTYAKSRTTTVTVSDNVSVNTSSLKYLWNTSTTAPAEGSFSTTFTNGSSISTPAGVTGTYYLWILGKDSSGNTMIARSNAFNLDNTAPVITLSGSNPANTTLGSTYSDAGATASDNINGNLTSGISTTSNVNVNTAGTYTVTYTVSDSSLNYASSTRTVVVNGITQYRYRTLSSTYTCDTCYETCYNTTSGTPSYSCSSGTLSGTSCYSSYNVYSTFSKQYLCTSGSWHWNSQTCSGNCNAPCSDGSSVASAYEYSTYCPPTSTCTSAQQGAVEYCDSYWEGTCNISSPADVTYVCPYGYTGGGSTSTCTQSYSCNPYSCNCGTSYYWGSWSSWSTTPVTADDQTQVETRTCTSYPCSST